MKRQLDPEIAAQRAREIAAIKARAIEQIDALTARVPEKVLRGGAIQAADWKREASKAASLARRQRVSADQLCDAVTRLRQYE
jgi:hypothetical protein